MTKDYDYEMISYPTIYNGKHRKLKVYFSELDKWTNEDIDIILIKVGFGGNANTNVYKNMRREFRINII